MSSTEITTREEASNRPAFPLSPELRVKIYELLLIHPNRSLNLIDFSATQWGDTI